MPCFILNMDTKEEFEIQAIGNISEIHEVTLNRIDLLKSNIQPVEHVITSGITRSFTLGLNANLLSDTVRNTYERFKSFAGSRNVLAMEWNDKIFSPCILSGSINYQELEYDNTGTCSAASLSISLLQVPDYAVYF